jgi:protein-tyrosine-phosphatase
MEPLPSPTNVLFVCTGNLCRSPMAAGLAQTALGQDSLVVFRSAGFVKAGRPPTEEAIVVMAELGLDLRAHRSSLVKDVIGTNPDLIVCMTRQHLRSTVELEPSLLARTFTLAELADLCQRHGARDKDQPLAVYLDQLRGSRKIAELARSRGPGDIPDPIGKPLPEYRRCVSQLQKLTQSIVENVFRSG